MKFYSRTVLLFLFLFSLTVGYISLRDPYLNWREKSDEREFLDAEHGRWKESYPVEARNRETEIILLINRVLLWILFVYSLFCGALSLAKTGDRLIYILPAATFFSFAILLLLLILLGGIGGGIIGARNQWFAFSYSPGEQPVALVKSLMKCA